MDLDKELAAIERLMASGDTKGAKQRLSRLPEKPPAAVVFESVILAREGDLDAAHEMLLNAREKWPDEIRVRAGLVAFYSQVQWHQSAVNLLKPVVDAGKSPPVEILAFVKLLLDVQSMSEALRYCKMVLDQERSGPYFDTACGYLTDIYAFLRDHDASLENALAFARRLPNPDHFHTALGELLYAPGVSEERSLEISLEFGDLMESALSPITDHRVARRADRRLRVAYLSPDFSNHVVAYFMIGLMEHHDPEEVEIYLYHTGSQDPVTQRFMAAAAKYRHVLGKSPRAIVDLILGDKVDVLVDLAGHTKGGLAGLLSLMPAPVVFSYCGHPATTGLRRITGRIVDWDTDPPGSEALNSERLWRLNRFFLSFTPLFPFPEIAVEPDRPPTLGVFNNPAKLGPRDWDLLARVMQEVPDAEVAVVRGALKASEPQQLMRDEMAASGMDVDRVKFWADVEDPEVFYRMYNRVDVQSDPWLYSGTTTTVDSLHMGVPVVTLPRRSHRSRVGCSLLKAAGFPEDIAANEDEYVARLVHHLRNRPDQTRREAIRAQVEASPLRDHADHARAMEAVYRQAFREWLDGLSGA